MVLPIVLLFLGLAIIPFTYMIYISFHDYNLAKGGVPSFIGVQNYISIFQDNVAMSSIRFTILLACVAVPIELGLGIVIAIFIRGILGEKIIRSSLLLPMMIPPVVAGIAWKMLYNFEYGPVNYLLSLFGVSQISWLGDYTFSQVGIILVDVWQWTPFLFLILYAGLQSIPRELVEAAEVDGASRFEVTRFVEIPLLSPLIGVALIIRVIDVLKIFDIIYMITWGGPGSATHSLSYYIYKVGVSFGWDIGYASAISLVLLGGIVALTTFLIRGLKLKESLGFK
jgi:multiple sugar transport system permease protein